jgi:S-DNA-T family DNA segregation ATPase FtsK/SpoIIIE
MSGAEHLVGKGDMLFNPLGTGKPIRVQGTFVSDEEVEKVIEHVRSQVKEAEYSEEVIDSISNGVSGEQSDAGDADELLPEAIELVVMQGQASVSMLQRRFRIGYNRAARIVDQMEARGIVGPQDGSKPRNVLMTDDEFNQSKEEVNESIL